MTIKNIKIFNVFFLFLLSITWLYTYKLIPINMILPVNNSIFERMKVVYYPLLVSSILEYFLYKKVNIHINNFNISLMIKSILGIIIYLFLYIPIYLFISKSLIIWIFLLIGIYIFTEYISFKILTSNELNIKVLPIIIVILGIILFTILTYYPVHSNIFFDYINFGYGILD